MGVKDNEDNHIDFRQLNVQKMYDALAMIIGRREKIKIKFTVTKKEEYKEENK